MSALLNNAILLSLFIFSLAMVLTVIRLFKGPSAQDRVLALDYLYILAMLCCWCSAACLPCAGPLVCCA